MGLLEDIFLLAGVTPLKSVRMAEYMQKEVAGMDIPEDIMHRLRSVPSNKAAEEGIEIACEQIAQFHEMRGVAGVHLMAIEWEHKVPEIAERARLLPRPKI
jgi:methylenetetrahydrofolate reductase (NADPH)